MLKYKLALISVGKLYISVAAFVAVGSVYSCVLLVRFLKNSYIEKFSERVL